MLLVLPNELEKGSVIRVFNTRRGLGRKAVVTDRRFHLGSWEVMYLLMRRDRSGRLLENTYGTTTYNKAKSVQVEGRWTGALKQGARGELEEYNQQGEAKVATTKTRSSKSGTRKSGAKKSSSASKNGKSESKRASNEELDKQAAQVVKMRDEDEKSWGEIEEALDIAPSRLRALYNRGGGKPTRQRKGAAKKEADAKKSASAKKKSGAKKRRPS